MAYHNKGKTHWNWKGGNDNCLDCGKLLSTRNAKRCKSCEAKRNLKNVGIKGKPSHNKGKTGLFKHSEKSKKDISKRMKGENHPCWIKDRTKIKRQDRKDNPLYKQWRLEVYKRDRYKCKIDNKNCKGRIEAHHILPWRDYKKLRYELINGITLCRAHHPRKRAEEKRAVSKFKKLLSS